MNNPPHHDQQELVERLQAIMLRMPRLTREIFMAHRLDDMPYEEIARRTGLTIREVERHIAMAILHLDRGLHSEPRPWWRLW
jgi:RNA polymerase sigma-70 factor (ECF subfamily)